MSETSQTIEEVGAQYKAKLAELAAAEQRLVEPMQKRQQLQEQLDQVSHEIAGLTQARDGLSKELASLHATIASIHRMNLQRSA